MQWSSFYELIVPEVGECPSPVIDAHLRRVAIEFCTTTQVWVSPLESFTTDGTNGTYDLIAPEPGSVVCAVAQLWVDGALAPFIPLAQMRRYSSQWQSESGEVEGFTQYTENTVTLYRIPVAGKVVTGHGVLRPSMAADGLPDWIGEKYFDELVAGAKARLMGMVNVPWANPQGSMLYAGIYKGESMAVAQARATARATGPISAPGAQP